MTYYRVIFLTTPHSSNSNNAWNVKSPSFVTFGLHVYYTYHGVRPVLYLDPTLTIDPNTDGSSTNPYKLIVS